jgi:hypothetical protein
LYKKTLLHNCGRTAKMIETTNKGNV